MGDIINMKGDWALAEWYPNHRRKAKDTGGSSPDTAEEETGEQATA